MSEHYSDAEAFQPEYLRINGRERLLDADAQLWIEEANSELREVDVTAYEDILEDLNNDFERYLPANDSVAFADCLAEAYPVKRNGNVAKKPRLYMLDDMDYHGFDIHTFHGEDAPELVLRFQEKLSLERSAPLQYYYVKPNEAAILDFNLEVFEELRGDETREILQASSVTLLNIVFSGAFATASPEAKQSMMDEFYNTVEYALAEAAPEEAGTIEIDATKCYAVRYGENVDTKTLSDYKLPQDTEVLRVDGEILRVAVLEFYNTPASEWTTPSIACDLYVVLDNSEDEVAYWVPVRAVEEVTFLRAEDILNEDDDDF